MKRGNFALEFSKLEAAKKAIQAGRGVCSRVLCHKHPQQVCVGAGHLHPGWGQPLEFTCPYVVFPHCSAPIQIHLLTRSVVTECLLQAAIVLGDGIEPERSGQFLCSLSFHHEGVSVGLGPRKLPSGNTGGSGEVCGSTLTP